MVCPVGSAVCPIASYTLHSCLYGCRKSYSQTPFTKPAAHVHVYIVNGTVVCGTKHISQVNRQLSPIVCDASAGQGESQVIPWANHAGTSVGQFASESTHVEDVTGGDVESRHVELYWQGLLRHSSRSIPQVPSHEAFCELSLTVHSVVYSGMYP